MSKISVVKGNSRKQNIVRAIMLLESEINKAIISKKSKQLFIKINAIDSNFPLACTHIDALEAVLDVFYDKFNGIIVGDNSFVFTKNKGGIYRKILTKFPKVKLSDLTEFKTGNIEFKRLDSRIIIGELSLLPKNAFSISLALPKTHDTFVYTGCLKNMFGCVITNRGSLHALNLPQRLLTDKEIKANKIKRQNLIKVIKSSMPDLSILDAYEGMEGEGPLLGNKIFLGIAMASLDGISLDKLASKITGMNNVPYLSMLNGSGNIEIIKSGFENINEISRKFKMHYKTKYMIADYPDFFNLPFDIKLFFSLLKRSYRLKDKIIEKIKSR